MAKYGGKGLHELFAAMPPFEMVKFLLVRAVSGRAPAKLAQCEVSSPSKYACRKVMCIDVSKAHLHALIDAGVDAFNGLPPECNKSDVCGSLNYCLYGMRPASEG